MQEREVSTVDASPRAEHGGRWVSPPFGEIRRMLAELAADFARSNSAVYEIGCATPSVLPLLQSRCAPDVRFVCADESPTLAASRRDQVARIAGAREVLSVQIDWDRGVALGNASVALLANCPSRTRTVDQTALFADVLRGLNDGGCLLLVAPVRGQDSLFNNLFARHRIERHYQASQDRAPPPQRDPCADMAAASTRQELRRALLRARFRSVDVFFEWYGTCAMAALK
jgi:tRNA (cmo5U34)-methyltransferase